MGREKKKTREENGKGWKEMEEGNMTQERERNGRKIRNRNAVMDDKIRNKS